MYGLLMDDIVKMRRNSCGKFYMPPNQNCHRDNFFFSLRFFISLFQKKKFIQINFI